jgi:hypothetical protein
MKVIQSRYFGKRAIVAKEPSIQWMLIRDAFNLHRDGLLERIFSNLPSYINFKFHIEPNNYELAVVTSSLLELKKRNVDMDFYQPLLKSIKKKTEVVLSNDCFLLEIDENIRMTMNRQLNVVA